MTFDKQEEGLKGYIHSFESLATLDGGGIRFAVFLVGCPLRCAYCHNPDTWSSPRFILEADELAAKAARYKPYFKHGGGVTFSGGEPLVQAEFITEAAEHLAARGISYVVDTSGALPLTPPVKAALAGAESVLLDLKFPSDELYRKYTGHGIAETLATLEYLEARNIKTVIRTVVVPKINDDERTLDGYLALLRGKHCVSSYELLGFHTMGFFKYERLGLENPFKDVPPLDAKRLEELQQYVSKELAFGEPVEGHDGR